MRVQKTKPLFGLLMLIIIAVVAMRIWNAAQITPWANFTPIGAMGLFGGACFNNCWKKFTFPLLTLFASDVIINQFIFDGKYGLLYGGWYWIYAIFACIVLLGGLIKTINVKNVVMASISAALVHWLAADFLVWAGGGLDLRTGLPLSRDWIGLQ